MQRALVFSESGSARYDFGVGDGVGVLEQNGGLEENGHVGRLAHQRVRLKHGTIFFMK